MVVTGLRLVTRWTVAAEDALSFVPPVAVALSIGVVGMGTVVLPAVAMRMAGKMNVRTLGVLRDVTRAGVHVWHSGSAHQQVGVQQDEEQVTHSL